MKAEPNRSMKILLQHARTQLYFRKLGDWTEDPQEAFDFQHSQKAINLAQQHRLYGVQIAVKFGDGECDEIVPLPLPTPLSVPAAPQPLYT